MGGRGYIRLPNLTKDYSERDPEKRYKMIYVDEIGGTFVLCKTYSSDGIRWKMNVGEPTNFSRQLSDESVICSNLRSSCEIVI